MRLTRSLVLVALVATACGSSVGAGPAPTASTAPAPTVPASTVPVTRVSVTTVPATTMPATTLPATTLPAAAGPFSAALAAVPASTPLLASFADVGRVLELDGVERPPGDAGDDRVADLARAVTGLGTKRVVPGELGRIARKATSMRAEVGFSVADVDQWVEAGTPPNQVTRVTGRIATDAVVAAATTFEPYAATAVRSTRDGFEVIRFGGDNERAPGSSSTWRRIGVGGRFAVRDGTFVWAANDATIDAALAATAGRGSLLATPGVAAVAGAVDEHPVYAALLAGPSPGDRWTASAIGFYEEGGARRAVVALAYSESTRRAGLDELRTLLAEGRSLRTGRPWAEVVTVVEVVASGATVIAVLDTNGSDELATAMAARDFVWASRG